MAAGPPSWKNSNGDISAKDYSIHSMFGSREGFSGTADLMTLFPVWPNLKRRLDRHLGKFKWQNFEWRHLCNGSSDLHLGYFMFGSRVALSGSADRMALFLIELQDTTRLVTLQTCCSSDTKPRRRSISSWDYRLTKG